MYCSRITEDKRKKIKEKRKELIDKYGDDPIIYSSGEFTTEKDFPKNMRINIDPSLLNDFPEVED